MVGTRVGEVHMETTGPIGLLVQGTGRGWALHLRLRPSADEARGIRAKNSGASLRRVP